MDHCPVLGKFAINLNPIRCYPKPFTRHIFHYDNGDFVKLNSLINEVPWISVLSGDIDEMYQSFVEFISAFRCECVPNFVVKINPRDKPGMTSRIKKLFKISNRLQKKASRSKLPIDILNHRNARRFAKCEWKKARFNYYYKLNLKLLDNNTSDKAWWKLSKSELGTAKRQSIPCLYHNNELVFDDVQKSTILNQFFADQCNITVPEDADRFLTSCKNDIDHSLKPVLDEISTSELEIVSILKTINVSKSSGSDAIGNIILRNCCYSICKPLCIIFNYCLLNAVIPAVWKKADVIPIFKKDDPTKCMNYRPNFLIATHFQNSGENNF